MISARVRLATILAAAALMACGSDEPGSARLKGLVPGTSVQEAVQQMGKGPLTATSSDTAQLVNGYRRARYFMDGITYDVVYARDLPGDVKEPVLQANETPVVFRNDSLMGWGWRFYVDQAMGKFNLPTPLSARDTMTASPAPNEQQDGSAPDTMSSDSPNASQS
jgi:hypothetical protein